MQLCPAGASNTPRAAAEDWRPGLWVAVFRARKLDHTPRHLPRGRELARAGQMSAYPTAVAPHENIHKEASAVHAWRVSQLIRLGLDWHVAETVADRVDWHAIAKLVRNGCPVSLAVAIVE